MPLPIPTAWLQPALHPLYLRLLCALLVQRGIDPDPLLADAQLSRRTCDSDDGLIAYAPAHALIVAALERSASPWLGLAFGAAAQTHAHGIVGNAALSSPTLDAALQTITRYAVLRTRAVRLLLEPGEAQTTLRIVPQFELRAAGGFLCDALLVVIERMLEALSGQRLRSARFLLPQSAPVWAARYRDYLSGQIEFDAAGWPGVVLDRSFLAQPCLTADASAHARAVLECDRELDRNEYASSLSERVRMRLASCGQEFPTAAAMAAQLHMSPRSLFRRLADEQSSYRELLDRQRSEHACWLLQHTSLSVERIAERLGYADSSNFSRSFRRWIGVTPREFRRQTGQS
ncbi:MAG TPA: AraC family transcriptional regulator ligand-binding domain-containing protein [Xanthomonadales bacterium]|nr:AraC family transcriptional regulator ligand-binding domain-containing protein [Xanthomonadales bacterium]